MEDLKAQLLKFKTEFDKITRAKHPMEIRHFVVGQHESRWRQWYQLCIETEAKWRALEEAEAGVRLCELEIEELKLKIQTDFTWSLDHISLLTSEAQRKTARITLRLEEIANEKIELEIKRKERAMAQSRTVMTGAMKEIADYLALAQEYPEFWGKSEDELVADGEREYWVSRLSRQVAVDLLTYGKPQAGNTNVLMQLDPTTREKILRESLLKTSKHLNLISETEQAQKGLKRV